MESRYILRSQIQKGDLLRIYDSMGVSVIVLALEDQKYSKYLEDWLLTLVYDVEWDAICGSDFGWVVKFELLGRLE